jgi:hypothetical protein
MRILLILTTMLFTCTIYAQSTGKKHPITRETFRVTLKIDDNQDVQLVRFATKKGEKQKAIMLSWGDVPNKRFQPGTVIIGEFRFSTFASDGGLGTTRVWTGKGKGNLTVSKVIVTESLPMVNKLAGVGDMAFRLE